MKTVWMKLYREMTEGKEIPKLAEQFIIKRLERIDDLCQKAQGELRSRQVIAMVIESEYKG